MSLITRIKSALGIKPALRNKPGWYAWIRGIPASAAGADVLNNRAVKTLHLTDRGLWEIDPPQPFIVTHPCTFGRSKRVLLAGDVACVGAIADRNLEPWRETGLDAEDESHRYLPPVPKIKEPEPCLTKS